jgi:hypothetical protein
MGASLARATILLESPLFFFLREKKLLQTPIPLFCVKDADYVITSFCILANKKEDLFFPC